LLVVCLLTCCVLTSCGWLPFYSEDASIIANPGWDMEAWRCSDLSLSNWAIQIEQGGEWRKKDVEQPIIKSKMQQENDAKDRRISVLHLESTLEYYYWITDPWKIKCTNCYKYIYAVPLGAFEQEKWHNWLEDIQHT
jgi:hypothetical protein